MMHILVLPVCWQGCLHKGLVHCQDRATPALPTFASHDAELVHAVKQAAHSQWLDTDHTLVLHASSLGSLYRLPHATRLNDGAHLGVGHEPARPQNAPHFGKPWHDAPHREAGVKVC